MNGMETKQKMSSNLADKWPQSSGATSTTSLIDLLVVLLLGGIGIYIALLGLYFDNLALYIAGLIIGIGSAIKILADAGKAIIEFVRSILDFIDYLRERRKNKNNDLK